MDYDNQEFWKVIEPIMFNDNLLEKTDYELDYLESLIKFSKGSHILDLCCGIGRHSISLAERGYIVTALDKNSDYIEKAMLLARKKRLNINFKSINFLNFSSNQKYQIILCLWNSFGFTQSETDDIKFLNNALNILDTNGFFVLGIAGKEIIVRNFVEQKKKHVGHYTLVKHRKIVDNGKFLNGKWDLYYKKTKINSFQLNQRIYSQEEIQKHLIDTGFKEVFIYGDFDGSLYDDKAKQMLVIAKK